MTILQGRVSYAKLLPFASLLISFLLVSSVLPRMLRERKSVPKKTSNLNTFPLDPAILEALVQESRQEKSRALPDPLEVSSFLNMPAMLIEVGISLPTTWPDSWYPLLPFPFGNLFFWRAVSWPIYSLPFWWLAGRGADALKAALSGGAGPKINIAEVIFMAVMGVLCAICGVGISLMPVDDIHDSVRWLASPGLLWLFLGFLPLVGLRRQKLKPRP